MVVILTPIVLMVVGIPGLCLGLWNVAGFIGDVTHVKV